MQLCVHGYLYPHSLTSYRRHHTAFRVSIRLGINNYSVYTHYFRHIRKWLQRFHRVHWNESPNNTNIFQTFETYYAPSGNRCRTNMMQMDGYRFFFYLRDHHSGLLSLAHAHHVDTIMLETSTKVKFALC